MPYPGYPEYSLDSAIAEFFLKTSATHESCNAKAKELVGDGQVIPVYVQSNSSYTVYAGPELDHVVQFRLKSLSIEPEIEAVAREIYGSLVPASSFHGQLGDSDDNDKEPLSIYVMKRMPGITYLDFILANGTPENSSSNCAWRKTLMADMAR